MQKASWMLPGWCGKMPGWRRPFFQKPSPTRCPPFGLLPRQTGGAWGGSSGLHSFGRVEWPPKRRRLPRRARMRSRGPIAHPRRSHGRRGLAQIREPILPGREIWLEGPRIALPTSGESSAWSPSHPILEKPKEGEVVCRGLLAMSQAPCRPSMIPWQWRCDLRGWPKSTAGFRVWHPWPIDPWSSLRVPTPDPCAKRCLLAR